MLFKVTRNDLKGQYLDSYHCPIAKCIKRTLNLDYAQVIVSGNSAIICGRAYPLPKGVNRKAHDRGDGNIWGQIIGGFKFELDIPEPYAITQKS